VACLDGFRKFFGAVTDAAASAGAASAPLVHLSTESVSSTYVLHAMHIPRMPVCFQD
jgi:hypothetical protein